MSCIRAGSAIIAAVLLTSCTLEPHYERPKAPVAKTWSDAAQSSGNSTTAVNVGWRQFFPDQNMQRLIEIALANNRDLRIAALNVQATQAQYRIQRSDLFPTVNAIALEQLQKYPSGVSASSGGTSGTGNVGTGSSSSGQTIRFYEAGVGFTAYEIDLFGRIRSLNHEAFEKYLSSEETRRSTQLSLIAQVVSAYLTVLADETILKVTRETLQSQMESYNLTKRSLDAGTTTALAFRQAATTVDTAKANLAQYTRQAAQDRNALGLLIGAPVPDDISFTVELGAVNLSADLPPGVPSEVLTNRPDVLAAEHALIAANADIGAARAAFFPSISLTGQFGSASTQLSGLFKAGSIAWSFTPQISVPIFTGGRNKASLDLSRIEKDINIAQYEKTLQTAFREVDDALSARRTLDEQLTAQRALLDDTSQSYQLANLRFKNGVDSFLPVLDAQRALYSAQQSVIGLELIRLQNMATLYKALGGGLREASTRP
ncbi:MAG: efflux transporter outer membrane subunit [Proteobacteria bacterium]|nr:efflux transporter outer membrane subunit [Pseudomonadota bacterium]